MQESCRGSSCFSSLAWLRSASLVQPKLNASQGTGFLIWPGKGTPALAGPSETRALRESRFSHFDLLRLSSRCWPLRESRPGSGHFSPLLWLRRASVYWPLQESCVGSRIKFRFNLAKERQPTPARAVRDSRGRSVFSFGLARARQPSLARARRMPRGKVDFPIPPR